jgi:hypothetical protein
MNALAWANETSLRMDQEENLEDGDWPRILARLPLLDADRALGPEKGDRHLSA